MLLLLRFLAVGCCIAAAAAAAVVAADADAEHSPEEAGFIEGDIIPSPNAFSALTDSRKRWPGGVIVYKYDSSLSSDIRGKVREAMVNLVTQTRSCVQFRKAGVADGNAFLLIRSGGGCAATVGFGITSTTHMYLSSYCSVGNIMHEFQHSLGVYHQQSRPDRDSYVRINQQNIIPSSRHNFNKFGSHYVTTYGIPYDYGSMMHYPELAFSSNGRKTIEPLRDTKGVTIGQRKGMSRNDVLLIQRMYNC